MEFNQRDPKIATVIRGKAPATSMSYHEDGCHLFVTSETDSRLRLVDCQRGVSDKPPLKFERAGVRLVQSTHHDQSVLYTGSGKDKTQNVGQRYAINYLSLHDNKILRQFRGHSGIITDISMSPVDDTFLTSSTDRNVRLWNLQQAGSLASLDMPKSGNGMKMDPSGCANAAFDETGLVFGISAPLDANAGHLIHLYDARNYGTGAFSEMTVKNASLLQAIQQKVSQPFTSTDLNTANWKKMRFNKSGKQILITTDSGLVMMIDGYEGTVTHVFFSEGENGPSTTPVAACFSSDDKMVLIGNEDGTISCYDADNGILVKKLEGHVGPVGCIASNPKYGQFASACTNVALWHW